MAEDLNPPLSTLSSRALATRSTSTLGSSVAAHSSQGTPAQARSSPESSRVRARSGAARGAGFGAPERAAAGPPDVSMVRAKGPITGKLWQQLRRRTGWALASAAVLAASLVWLGWPRAQQDAARALPRAHPPALPVPEPLPAPVAAPPPEPIELAEGATAELHTIGSIVRTQELSEESLRVRLSGGARFEVEPPRARHFVVESAQVLVRGLGTGSVSSARMAFSVDPEDTRTRVAVEHGRVQIMWWNGATILHAGQSDVFPPLSESPFGRAYAEPHHRDAHKKRGKHAKHAHKRKKSRDAQAKVAHAKAHHHAKGRHAKIAARLRGR